VRTPAEKSRPGIQEDELAAWLALHAAEGLGAASMTRLVSAFGSPQAVLSAAREELLAVPKLPVAAVEGIAREGARLGRHLGVARRLAAEGIRALRREDRDYPPRLLELPSSPPLLFVKGRLPPPRRRALAIVGTTRASEQGVLVATRVASHFARSGWAIVSGNASGIDAAAHRGAFAAGGPTVMVLPTGILAFRPHPGYPPGAHLWRRAAAVSEVYPLAPWATAAALARNRLIAALSDAVLVVETRERGGALSTLRHALAIGRRGFVVRFKNPSLSAAGNSLAEAHGARPVRSLRELETVLSRKAPRHTQPELPW